MLKISFATRGDPAGFYTLYISRYILHTKHYIFIVVLSLAVALATLLPAAVALAIVLPEAMAIINDIANDCCYGFRY